MRRRKKQQSARLQNPPNLLQYWGFFANMFDDLEHDYCVETVRGERKPARFSRTEARLHAGPSGFRDQGSVQIYAEHLGPPRYQPLRIIARGTAYFEDLPARLYFLFDQDGLKTSEI